MLGSIGRRPAQGCTWRVLTPGGRYPHGTYPPPGGWYRPPVYYAPWRYPPGYYYRPWGIGMFLPSLFLSSAYAQSDTVFGESLG